jgi:hypothetical protein
MMRTAIADNRNQSCQHATATRLGLQPSLNPLGLTDVVEGTKLLLRFVNLAKNEVLFGTEVTVSNVHRLATVELVLPLPRLPIQESGSYALELVCDGSIIGSCRITAENLDEKTETPPTEQN